jgi:hypothetical protein
MITKLSARIDAFVRVSSTNNTYSKEISSEPPSEEGVNVSAVSTTKRKSLVTAIGLSKRWGISIEAAAATLDASTQSAVRNIFTASKRKV